MEKLYLYNTLTRKIRAFKPIKPKIVKMYSCGPTVYNYAHIGNLRTYIFNDILKRVLTHLGFKVKHAMNITDVDDKTIKGSQQEKTPLKEFTRKYEDSFFNDINELNIIKPILTKATENINEMVKIIKKIMEKKYAYKAEDGVYFSISKFKNYGKLANLEKIKKTKARILADNYDKSNARDFALWKFYVKEDGNVFWETEIGKGRPGWHIECSAMSMRFLGEHFDIHTGAQDLIFPHHTNEIAQSETATGKKFVNYWLHPAFLNMKEEKMSKSLGNIITLKEIKDSGYLPVHFRYLCLLTHYRKPLLFSFENLDSAKNSFERLKRKLIELRKESHKGLDKRKEYELQFHKAIYYDLNIPKALQVFWKALDDFDFAPKKKIALLEHFDSVLGLGIKDMREISLILPKEVEKLIQARERLRKNKLWAEADIIRERIRESGYLISDTPQGPKVEKII